MFYNLNKMLIREGVKMRMFKKILSVILAMSLLVISCQKEDAASSDSKDKGTGLTGSVSTNGSTSMQKVISTLIESFMEKNPGVTVTYDPTGSGSGVESVDTGKADIGLASRALKSGEAEKGLKSTTLALDGIAIIVNESCAIDDLALEKLSSIFTGEITNWKEIGGADLAIACIGREAGSGTRDGFESITDTKGKCKLQSELTSTGSVISSVANNQNAIGYASVSAVENQKGIKVLRIDGVAPTEGTIQEGSYKIQRPFILVTKQDKALSPAAQAFFDYITGKSAEVNQYIKASGAVPVL